MSTLHGVVGRWGRSESAAVVRRRVVFAFHAGCVGLFICLMATLFGISDGGEWLGLPPDYSRLGWCLRIVGAAIGVVLLIYLYAMHRAYLGRKFSRTFTGRMTRFGLAVCSAAIVWEFVLLGSVLFEILIVAYCVFNDGA